MTVSASTQIPKTSDPAVFQRQCQVLFECILRDPTVKEYGSSGQAQQGIDLLGRRKDVSLDHWVGIQCKLKIKAPRLEKKTVREEAEAALAIDPPLKEFILVTTAPDHVELDKEAAAITHEQAKHGRDFTVLVWGWDTLQTHILKHEEAINAFFPDAFPHVQEIRRGQARLFEEVGRGNEAVIAEVRSLRADLSVKTSSAPVNTEEGSRLDTVLDRQIDGYRDLLNEGHSATAAKLLQKMWEDLPADAAGRIRYRIRANIAASKLRLGEEEEAGQLYHEAFDYAPQEPKAAAFKVLGLVLLGRAQEAYEFGVNAIETAEDKTTLVTHTLIAANQLPDIVDPSSIIPAELEHDDSVTVAKVAFARMRSDPAWRAMAAAAHGAHPENKNLARFAAEAVIEEGCDWADQNHRSLLPAELKERVKEAAGVLSARFTDMLARPDVSTNFDASLCLNLTTAYRLLRDFDSARHVITRGVELAPDDKEVRDGWAKFILESGDEADAGEVVQYLLDPREGLVARFVVQANQSKWADIVKLSDTSDVSGLPVPDQAFVQALVLLARSKANDDLDPREDAEALLARFPDQPIVPIVLHEVAQGRRDREWAIALYERAEQQRAQLNLPARLILARIAEQEDDPQTVTELLFGHIPLNRDSEELRLLGRAFVNAPPRQTAVDFVAALPEELSQSEFFSRVIGGIEFNRGALDDAEAAFRAAIAARPSSLEAHLGLVNTFLRLDRRTDVEKHLRELDLQALEGPAHLKVGLAQLLTHFGRSVDGLAYGYEVALQNRNDAKASLLYIGLLLPEPTGLHVPAVGETITVDCAVEIERQDGRRLRVTIATGPDRPAIDHYSPEHSLARMLLDAKVGDTVVLEQAPGTPQSWRVLGFKHKYLVLLHDIMESFPARFPDARGFYVVETPENDVGPILERIKSDSQHTADLLERYAAESFPLCLLGACLGQTAIGAAAQLVTTGRLIKTCIGMHPERRVALDAVAAAREKGVALDVYTAWCAHTLGLLTTIKDMFPRVVLPQSVLDEIRAFRKRYEDHGERPLQTIGYRDGQYLRQEISPEELRQSAETINDTIEALARECEILPAAAPGSPSQLEMLFLEVARPGSLDPAYLAATEDLLLLSDDLHYRNLAAQLYQCDGVWLQVVLMAALEERIIDFATYSHAVGALSVQRHEYVSVSADVLTYIVKHDDTGELPRLAAALAFIGTPTADIPSHFRVAWDFMLHIWNDRALSDLRKAKACGMVLNRLLPMYSPHGDFAEILRQMIKHSGHRPKLRRYILAWARGHFIVLDKSSAANPAEPQKSNPKKADPMKGKKKRRGRRRR